MLITQDHLYSICEIKSMENEMVATGIVQNIEESSIEVVPKSGFLPMTPFGTRVKINIYNSKAGFRAMVGTVYTSSLKFIRLVEMEMLTEYERRNFFRVNIKLKATTAPERDSEKWQPAVVSDISLGGALVSLESEEEMVMGQSFWLRLRLCHRVCCFQCVIQRVIEDPEDGRVRYGCAFQESRENDQNALCAFIFEKQREQLSRQKEMNRGTEDI